MAGRIPRGGSGYTLTSPWVAAGVPRAKQASSLPERGWKPPLQAETDRSAPASEIGAHDWGFDRAEDSGPSAEGNSHEAASRSIAPRLHHFFRLEAPPNFQPPPSGQLKTDGRQPVQRKINDYYDLLSSGKTTLTNDSTSDVTGIGKAILSQKTMIGGVPDLVVIAGYHGDSSGNFSGAFTTKERQEVDDLAKNFSNVKTLLKPSAGLDDDAMRKWIKAENIFFTWCYSDKRIANL